MSNSNNSGSGRVKDDPYRALNLPHTATREDIRRSYKQLAKKYHPDTWSAPCFTAAEKQHATRIFQGVSDAFALLDDGDRKAEYDRNRRLGLYPDHHGRDDHSSSASAAPQPPPPLVRPPSRGAPPPLPRGWTTATDPSSGSLYYCHVSSGRSSWAHPLLENNNNHYNNNGGGFGSTPGGGGGGQRRFPRRSRDPTAPAYHNDGYYSPEYDRTIRTTSEPDRHRCGAFLALWLCPPLGILAFYHSIMVGRCWSKRTSSSRSGVGGGGGDDDYNEFPSCADCYGGDEPGEEKEGDSATATKAEIDDPVRHYGDLAHGHSKRAGAWACLGNTLGILFWGYHLLNREGGGDGDHRNEWWPDDWNLDEWWPDDWDLGGDP